MVVSMKVIPNSGQFVSVHLFLHQLLQLGHVEQVVGELVDEGRGEEGLLVLGDASVNGSIDHALKKIRFEL